MSSYNIGSTRDADAFEIIIPDIPFLNFNFDNIINPGNNDDTTENEIDGGSDRISTNSESSEQDKEPGANIENSFHTYDSLPFPSNTINKVISGQSEEKGEEEQDENEKGEIVKLSDTNKGELDKIASLSPESLPLIGDYTDFPSTFLSSSEIEAGKPIPNQYIIVLKDDESKLSDFVSMMSENTKFYGVELLQVYERALNGLAIKVPNDKVIDAIADLPMVDYVENDVWMQAFAQTLPTGINRIDGDQSSTKSGNEKDNVNVDIAILDTGIDLKHSDLNVYHQKSFVSANTGLYSLFGSKRDIANDDNGHGTHVAGIAAAKDNTVGSVGVAPGAKLWAIKILDSKGSGPLSTIIKGIDYVTQNANQIEVANLSFGCECKSAAFDTAINNSIKAGIVFVVAAGNEAKDATSISPANNPNVISVSAIADSDGICGANGPSTGYGSDDTLASFSNYGRVVDIAAPGAKIYSTYKGNAYATMSGTSMASPHVAGMAALYLHGNPDASPSTVKSALLDDGSKANISCDANGYGYFTGDKDEHQEPLLYVRNY
ncbi:MAG TPA: S8 family peptidase [Candidatus Saccharimonadales bacterium]|nr:S8 family peptidase [Candidatus Saccharimonadales bacterium]